MKKSLLFASIAVAMLALQSTPVQAALVSLPTVANADFEADAGTFTNFPGYVGPISPGNPTEITDWAGAGNRGINPGGGSPFRDNGNNATTVAFLQGDNATIAQTITGWETGKEFRIAFDYNARNGSGGNTAPFVGVTATAGGASFVDSSVPPTGGSNAYYAGNILLTPASSTNTLSFTANVTSGDRTLLVDNVRVFRNGPTIADNGFENPVQPGTSGFDAFEQANGTGNGTLAGSAWSFSGPAGITRNISAFQSGGIRAPEGEQHAILQGGNASMEQSVSGFTQGAMYELSLLAMARQGQAGGNNLEVILDLGLATELTILDIAEVTANAFTEETSVAFAAAKDSYTLTIRSNLGGGNLSGDRTTFVDNIWFNQLTEVPEPASATLCLLGAGLLFRRRRAA